MVIGKSGARVGAAVAVVIAAAAVGPALAQQHVKESIISDAASGGWTFDGPAKVKVVDAAAVPGGKAIEAVVAAKGKTAWDIQARHKMKDGVAEGDTVTFGFYAKALKPDPGKDTAHVNVRVQRAAAPYDAALEGGIDVGPDWSFQCVSGPARIGVDAGQLIVAVQLSGEPHTIAFGPYMATKIPAKGAAVKSGLPCGQPLKTS